MLVERWIRRVVYGPVPLGDQKSLVAQGQPAQAELAGAYMLRGHLIDPGKPESCD